MQKFKNFEDLKQDFNWLVGIFKILIKIITGFVMPDFCSVKQKASEFGIEGISIRNNLRDNILVINCTTRMQKITMRL